jgi:hypothetical protein
MVDEDRPARNLTRDFSLVNESIIQVGQRITILEGPLVGCRARIVRREKDGYLMVELDQLGQKGVYLWIDEAAISAR